MLYPNMDQVHIKSPVMLFPKEKKPEDIFSVSTKETIKRPVMYQQDTSTIKKGGVRLIKIIIYLGSNILGTQVLSKAVKLQRGHTRTWLL
jgi:hypothetical protein